MIDASTPVFPNNVLDLLFTRFSTAGVIDPEPDLNLRVAIYKRSLRPTDAIQSVGIFPMNWNPDEESFEIRGGLPGPSFPTLGRYWIGVQGFVKDADEANGLAVHSVLSSLIKQILYHDVPLRVGLGALQVSLSGGRVESFKRSGVRIQRYLSNEIAGSFVYLTTTEFWIETETT